jgi:hypothetical protein
VRRVLVAARFLTGIRDRLGESAFGAQLAGGRYMGNDEAVALALWPTA